jgi:ribosomal protein S18 acetylase RimI-like enzyme
LPCPELDYLAVGPDYQRQGIGSRLVESGIQQANKLGLEIFLVAMGGNALAMYQKYGFKLIDQNSQDLRPWGFDDSYDTYILIKQPEVYQEGAVA